MITARKRLSAVLAAVISLAATGLPAAPAAAQSEMSPYGACRYDPYWLGWYRTYVTHWEPCTPNITEYLGTCIYEPSAGYWVRYYITHQELCDPPY